MFDHIDLPACRLLLVAAGVVLVGLAWIVGGIIEGEP